jgi:hypothetical protein
MKTYAGVELWLHHSWLRNYVEVSGRERPPGTKSTENGWDPEPVREVGSGEKNLLYKLPG